MIGDTAVKCSVCSKFDILRDGVYYHSCKGAPTETIISCPDCKKLHELGHCDPSALKIPHKCPACDGRGRRDSNLQDGGTGFVQETCPACNGTGVVWES